MDCSGWSLYLMPVISTYIGLGLKQHPDIANAIEKEIRDQAEKANQLTRLGKSGTAVEVESDTSEDDE